MVIGVVVVALALLAFVALVPGSETRPDAAAAQREALGWADAEVADEPRRVGDGWEVDVRRADGSVVEVTLGRTLDLRELDEERGPGGAPAHDELAGRARARAIAAARPRAGRVGKVTSVEREGDGTIEVNFATAGEAVIEVELDRRLRVRDVDREEAGDE
jgi:hypothetical protein